MQLGTQNTLLSPFLLISLLLLMNSTHWLRVKLNTTSSIESFQILQKFPKPHLLNAKLFGMVHGYFISLCSPSVWQNAWHIVGANKCRKNAE